jgi:hypothetical protein
VLFLWDPKELKFRMRRLSSRDRLEAVDERRKRKRVAVHWPVRLFEPMGNKSVESTTENLSSEGFYYQSRRTFKIGERLRCEIVIPEATLGLDGPIVLECHVTVRRVEHLESWFGLGCHIEDYSVGGGVLPGDASLS